MDLVLNRKGHLKRAAASARGRNALRYHAMPIALAWGVAAAMVAPQTALAQAQQTAAPADMTGSQNAEIEEVTVTARRRSENLERVPTTITAFNAQQMADRAIHSESDLQLMVPGLTVRQTEGNNELTYAIRGQTRESYTGSPSAVVPYIDEVQLNVGGAYSFYDLDSVQVLKGPQGTLFGRNATGGAVLYTTTKPKDDNEGYIIGRVGNLDLTEMQGAVNAVVVPEKVLVRAAVDLAHRGGYVHNVYYNNSPDLGWYDRQSGRLSVSLNPTDHFSNLTVFEYDHGGGTSTGASYLYSVNQCGVVHNGFTLACPSAGLYNPTAFDAVFGPGAWNTYLAAHKDATPGGLLAYLQEAHARGPYVTDSQIHSRYAENDWFVANTTTYHFDNDTLLKNIFGASRSDIRDDVLETGEPFGIEFTENPMRGQYGDGIRTTQLSDEIQLQGKALSDKLTYIMGAYYQQTENRQYSPQAYFDLRPFAITGATADYLWHDKTEAVYAQGTYDFGSFAPGLSFTAGIRYTWEQVNVEHNPGDTFYPAPRQSVDFSDPSWDVGFEYQATPELMAYIKTRGSFRAGGLNGFAPPIAVTAAGGGDIFEPEHIKDVEGGVKFNGLLAGMPSRINLAVYQDWIDGIQRVMFPIVNGASIAVTVNAPAAQVSGFELDTVFEPTSWLQAGFAGAYTDARYTENKTVLFGVTYLFGPYADTPLWTGTAFVRFQLPVPEELGDMSLRFDGYAQTAQYFSNTDATVTPGTRLPGYGVVNARLDWNQINGSNLSGALFVKNMLDKAYFVGGLSQGASLGLNAAAVAPPRTFGVELKYSF